MVTTVDLKIDRLIDKLRMTKNEPIEHPLGPLKEVASGLFKREALDGVNVDVRFGRDANGVRVELP